MRSLRLLTAALVAIWSGVAQAGSSLPPGMPLGGGSPFDITSRSTLVPAVHLAHVMLTDKPVACIAGDSTATPSSADFVTRTDSLWARLEHELVVQNPSKTWTFENYAIAGATLQQFNQTLASGWPSWWTNHTLTWVQQIGALTPRCTVIFINFGLNDPGQEAITTWLSSLNGIMAWTQTPDIAIITNPQANPNDGTDGTPTLISGYLANASLQRTLAMDSKQTSISGLPPIGFIDVGRAMQKAVMGGDPVNQIMGWVVYPGSPVVGGSTFPFSFAPTPSGDYDVTFSLSDSAGLISSSSVVSLSVGDGAGGTGGSSGNSIHFLHSGSFWFANYYGANSTFVSNATTDTNCATTGTITFEAAVKQDHVLIFCGAAAVSTQVADIFVPRIVSPFTPTLTLSSPPGGGETVTTVSYATGSSAPTPNTIYLSNYYGITGGGGQYGGQLSKHASSIGLNQVYAQALTDGVSFGTEPPLSSASGLTAAGTTQTTALILPAAVDVIATCASGAGVILPSGATGTRVTVTNNGANACLVYPATGSAINALGANVGYSLGIGSVIDFVYQSATTWVTK